MSGATIRQDGTTLVIRVPMRLARHGARKRIIAPDDAPDWAPPAPRIDSTMVKAIARAFRWRRMIETGVHDTVDDIATAEKINPSYVSRVLRLSLLAPDIVEAILDGRQAPGLTLAVALRPFPVTWREQLTAFEASGNPRVGTERLKQSRTP